MASTTLTTKPLWNIRRSGNQSEVLGFWIPSTTSEDTIHILRECLHAYFVPKPHAHILGLILIPKQVINKTAFAFLSSFGHLRDRSHSSHFEGDLLCAFVTCTSHPFYFLGWLPYTFIYTLFHYKHQRLHMMEVEQTTKKPRMYSHTPSYIANPVRKSASR